MPSCPWLLTLESDRIVCSERWVPEEQPPLINVSFALGRLSLLELLIRARDQVAVAQLKKREEEL
jgi:hypothetical protein